VNPFLGDPLDEFQGNSIGVTIKVRGDFNAALTERKARGMNVIVSGPRLDDLGSPHAHGRIDR
jgi:hypothetical protein